MTKLRRKLQQLAKKRAHKKTVEKRKYDRASKELEEKKAKEAAKLEELAERDMLKMSDPNWEDVSSDEEAATMDTKTKQLIGGLVMNSGPRLAKGKKKQLTRKQLRRKEKTVEKGQAIADQISKKWGVKKLRVKQRAQVRNENLHD